MASLPANGRRAAGGASLRARCAVCTEGIQLLSWRLEGAHGARNNEHHACARQRDGELAGTGARRSPWRESPV